MIVLQTINESMVKDFPINEHMHIMLPTYYRLLAAELLPKEVHKVIYLDCDCIVCGDIRGIWDVDLTVKAIAGVKDCREEIQQRRLGYSLDFDYVNAGVLVYNLDYWREHHS